MGALAFGRKWRAQWRGREGGREGGGWTDNILKLVKSNVCCIHYSYDLIDLERGHGGYGGNVGDQWDAVNAADGSFTKDACFASGW